MFGILAAGGVFLFQTYPIRQGVVKSTRDAIIKSTDPVSAPINQLIEKEKIIIATESGFIPKEQTAWPFDQVFWANHTEEAIFIEQASEGSDEENLTFSLGEILPGESSSTYFAYAGRYRYHDRYHPERVGYVIVE